MKCPDDLIKLKTYSKPNLTPCLVTILLICIKLKTYSKPNPKQDYSNDNLKLKIQ